MILASATQKNDRPLLIVGLTQRNMEHLDAGHPAFKSLDAVGVEADLLILHGDTAQDISDVLNADAGEMVGSSMEAASLSVEYELSLDGAFQGQPASTRDEAFDRALELKALNPESVVAIVVTERA